MLHAETIHAPSLCCPAGQMLCIRARLQSCRKAHKIDVGFSPCGKSRCFESTRRGTLWVPCRKCHNFNVGFAGCGKTPSGAKSRPFCIRARLQSCRKAHKVDTGFSPCGILLRLPAGRRATLTQLPELYFIGMKVPYQSMRRGNWRQYASTAQPPPRPAR